jgi:putative tryptophan/tyrosine transport system substrate-binding protein
VAAQEGVGSTPPRFRTIQVWPKDLPADLRQAECAANRASIVVRRLELRCRHQMTGEELPMFGIKRREFISLLGGAAAAWPVAARAQQSERMRRIGVLAGSAESAEVRARIAAFQQALQKLGWREDHDIRIDVRWLGSDPQRIQAETSDLIARKPEVVVSGTSIAVAQILQTSAIPIVFAGITDPVSQGFVKSLARPGGNATGFAAYEVSLGGKWIETLKELWPGLGRAAVLYEPTTAPYMPGILDSIVAAAPSFGVQIEDAQIRNIDELDGALALLGRQPNTGVIVPPASFTNTHSALLVALTAKYRTPTIYAFRTYIATGGLISYGVDGNDLWTKAAGYVDRILRGAKPGDLPVQTPTKFELAINLKTAKALGLEIPATLLARADEVIE